MEQYAGGVITEGHSEELKLRWKGGAPGEPGSSLEVLDQLIGADEGAAAGEGQSHGPGQGTMAALGNGAGGKMQGDAAVCRDMAAAADVLRENMPVLEQAKGQV